MKLLLRFCRIKRTKYFRGSAFPNIQSFFLRTYAIIVFGDKSYYIFLLSKMNCTVLIQY